MSRFHTLRQMLVVLLLTCLPLCAAQAAVTDLLLVVVDPSNLTSTESTRRTFFENWGYQVTLIGQGASQANFHTAAAAHSVAYVPSTINAGTLDTKLKDVTIGVVNEHSAMAHRFGFSDSSGDTSSKNFFAIQTDAHYVTYGTSGEVTISSSNQSLVRRTGTLAAGVLILANVERTPGQHQPGLLSLEVGAALYGGGSAAGRRVLLPIGSSTFSLSMLNSAGQEFFRRAIEWAARPNPSVGEVLMVVTSTGSPNTQEVLRQMQIDVWGYDITLIAAGADQASFNSALGGKDAVYLSREISPASVGTKLTDSPIGVVSEEAELSDEFGISSSRNYPSGSSVTVTDDTHPITEGLDAGTVTLFSSNVTMTATDGTLAPGLQTLATVAGAGSLVVLEAGAVLTPTGNAAGRRVQLPWGGSGFDFSLLNVNGKAVMRQAIQWAADPPGTLLLLVVADSQTLHAQERARMSLVESWGYSVNILDDDASQADYNLAAGANEVVYISETIDTINLGIKLRDAPVGIVNEDHFAAAQFEIASSQTGSNESVLDIANGAHYITSPLGAGPVTILSSSQPVTGLGGSFAPGMQVLGQWGSNRSLVTVEAGAKLLNDYHAAGRRVQLPWGQSGFDIDQLNASGQTLLKRSLEWAAALVGHWKLDETSGLTAADSSGNDLHGTLVNGPVWTDGKIGGGLELDGVDDYVDLGNSDALNITGDLTLSAWVKFHSIGSAGDAEAIITWANSASTYPFHLLVMEKDTDDRVLRFNDGSGPRDTLGQISIGTWHHVAATISGTTLSLYIDGQADAANPHTLGARSAGNGFCTLGRVAAQRPHGILDDVRVYKYAMGGDEIQTLKGLGGKSPGVRILKWIEVR